MRLFTANHPPAHRRHSDPHQACTDDPKTLLSVCGLCDKGYALTATGWCADLGACRGGVA